MSSIEEAIDEQQAPKLGDMENKLEPEVTVRRGIDLSFLKTPTGEGEIEDYMTHVLNFNNSRGMARVIRGVTGFAGNLNFAVLDIAVGLLDLSKTAKKVQPIEPAHTLH